MEGRGGVARRYRRALVWAGSIYVRACSQSRSGCVLSCRVVLVGKRLVEAAIDERRSGSKVAHLQQRSDRTMLRVGIQVVSIAYKRRIDSSKRTRGEE